MIVNIIFFAFLERSHSNDVSEDIIPYDQYSSRFHSLFYSDIGGIKLDSFDRNEAMRDLEKITKKIYDRFLGDRCKLAAFTSVYISNYSYSLDQLLYTYESNKVYESILKHRISTGIVNLLRNMQVEIGSLIDNENLSILDKECIFFDIVVKEYSFRNIVRLFLQNWFKDVRGFYFGFDMEHAYNVIKFGNDFKPDDEKLFYGRSPPGTHHHYNFREDDLGYSSESSD